MASVRRFRMEVDPHVRCCCSMEDHLSGEYVLLEDYMKLLREYNDYKRGKEIPNRAECAVSGCEKEAVMFWGGRPHCYDCLPPMMKGGGS